MSYNYDSIIKLEQTGTIDIPLEVSATQIQVTIISSVISPATDNTVGIITFDASPFIHQSVPVQFEPVFDGANSTIRQTINFAAEDRSFVIMHQALQTLRVIPDASVVNPYSVVIRQGIL